MTDFLKVLQQAQVDKNVSQRNPVGSPTDGENEITLTEQDIDNANKPQGRLVKDPTNVNVQDGPNYPGNGISPEEDPTAGMTPEQIALEQTRMDRTPVQGEISEPLPENPYTWTPEYTQRGFVEEIGTSLMRGFGKHVVGGTGDILALVNGLIPGWEIREGNALSRGLQEVGKEFEENYKVFMPDELKDNEFTLATFTNPNFWTKTAAEYIPQLVEMIILSKGAGGVAKRTAQSGVKGLSKGMTRESLERIGSKVVANSEAQVMKGVAAQSNKILGQGPKGWRALFMDTTGEATAGFATGAEMFGGGLGMNLLAGLQNAGGLMNEMKDLRDSDGNLLYTEEQLADMASSTMIENLKYLPVDMLSYGMVYAKSTGQFNKLLNPFNKTQGKKFFNSAEQLTASSKSFTRSITPIMQAVNATESKLLKYGKKLKNTASAVSKPLFEGYEETFQETFEDWAKKKAVAKVTGQPITIDGKKSDGSMPSYFEFYLSKENEATRTIAFALGMLGGAGSNIVEAVNKKAEIAAKNYSRAELMKRAAKNELEYDYQAIFLKEQLVDNAMDGNVDSVAMLEAMAEEGIISEDMKSDYITFAKNMTLEAVKAKSLGLNDLGKVAYLNHKFNEQANKNGYKFEKAKVDEKIKNLNEEYQGKEDTKEYKAKMKDVEDSWETMENMFARDIHEAQQGILGILSGKKGDVSNITHEKLKAVQNQEGNTVAIALSEQDYNDYYNKTNDEIYKDARNKKYDPRGMFSKLGSGVKNAFKTVKEGLIGFKEKTEEKIAEIKNKGLDGLTPEQRTQYDKAKASKEAIDTELASMKIGEDGVTKDSYNAKKAEATALEVEMADLLAKSKANIQSTIKNAKGGRAYMDPLLEPEEEADEEAPVRKPGMMDKLIKSLFTKKNQTEENIIATEEEIAKKLEDAKIDFTDEVKAKKALERLISTEDGVIQSLQTKDDFNKEEFIAYLMKMGKEGNFKSETKIEKEARIDRNAKKKKKTEEIKKAQRETPTGKNVRQHDLGKKFNDPNWNKEYKKIVKQDPTQATLLQEEYDEYLSSIQAGLKYGPTAIIQQVAVNQHLRQLYPDSKIQAYAMNNMVDALGGTKALGYAALAGIFIDEKVWFQSEIFMHEFAHIHYSLSKNDPATVELMKQALNDKQLVSRIEDEYADDVVYYYAQPGWKSGMKKDKIFFGDMTAEQKDQLGKPHRNGVLMARKAPMHEQPVIMDELFANYLQGPMSKKFSKYFNPRTDLPRQAQVKNWWRRIKDKAKKQEDNNFNLAQKLSEEKLDGTNINDHIMNNFVSMIQGKPVTVGGRFALDNEKSTITKEDNLDIMKRLREEQAKSRNKQNKADIKMVEAFYAPIKIDEDKKGTLVDDWDLWDRPLPEANEEFSQVDALEKLNQDIETNIGTMWDDNYNATMMKTTEVIKHFVEQFNKVSNERKSAEIEAVKNDPKAKKVDAMYTEGINLNKFTEGLMDLAYMYDSPIDFIRVLEQTNDIHQKEFMKHLNAEFKQDALQRLVTMHLLYGNTAIIPGIIHTVDKNGEYTSVTAQSANDPIIIKRTLKQLSRKTIEQKNLLEDAIDILERGDIETREVQEAAAEIIKFYGHDLNIAKKIIGNGYLIINKKNVPIVSALKQLLNATEQEIIPFTGNKSNDEFMMAGTVRTKLKPIKDRNERIISSILLTGKRFGSTSVVKGPTGNNVTTRMFSNHAIKLFNKIVVDLKNSEYTGKAKKEFITKYSNSDKSVTVSSFNPLLESFYDNFHLKGELPLMVLDFGSKNEMFNKAKNYKDMSAEQQLINELLQFTESIKNEDSNYLGSMDILGNSSRRLLVGLPRIENILTADGNFNAKGASHLNKIFSIYESLNKDKKKAMEGIPNKIGANFPQFEKAIKKDADKWIKYLAEHSESLSKVKSLQPFYQTKDGTVLNKLTKEGETLIKNFIFNRVANTFYVHEMMSPGLFLDGLTKNNKGHVAPVIALDPRLRVEMLPMDDEFKLTRPLKDENGKETEAAFRKRFKQWEKNVIVSNDGIQYILPEHADAIQALNKDFNKGYKLYSHTIEKENAWFANQTSQMKGYTTVLTEEAVTNGNQQHLYPIWKILTNRNEKFKADYLKKYGEEYDPNFRTQTSVDSDRPKYIPIVTPVSAEKAGLFHTKELLGLKTKFSLEQLKNPEVQKEYEALLDKLYYTESGFVGLDGSNFGPQQIMDKRYTQATFGTQVLTSIPHAKKGAPLNNALRIQELINQQKWVNFKKAVLDEMASYEIDDDFKYSRFIREAANKLNSDPYTIAALTYGELPYSPHVADFAGNQFRAQIIRHGNNLKVTGTYGQTISDMGYKFVTDKNVEGFINRPNRDKTYPAVEQFIDEQGNVRRKNNPKVSKEYINGTSKLNSYGWKIVDGKQVTVPFEIVLPEPLPGDQTVARESIYDEFGGVDNARGKLLHRNKKGFLTNFNTLKRLKLLHPNGTVNTEAMDLMLEENGIYSSPVKNERNRIGTYIPGETVMLTRIPHNGPAFVGVAEVVGFHDTGASNIIVPAEYSWLVGADHDGDALFIYQASKRKDGSIDERMGDSSAAKDKGTIREAGYGNWNKAFDMLIEQWTAEDMRITLETPLRFESNMDAIIEENNEALNPEQYKQQRALEEKLNRGLIDQKAFEKKLAVIKAEADFVIPFGTEHYTKQYNNSVVAQQTIGIAFNTHRALNLLATYETMLSNGTVKGKNSKGEITEKPKLVNINIDGQVERGFTDRNADKPINKNKGINSRIHLSTILANIVLDSTKNGHADALNLNINSISSAMILVNLGFDIQKIGLLFNHPMAKEYIEKRNEMGNDYLETGSYKSIIYKYKEKYENTSLEIYSNPSEFSVTVDPKSNRYNSDENGFAILRLMHYLSKISDDISIITDITSGHNKMELNVFALEKQVTDLNALITNKKREAEMVGKKEGKKNSTLYFREKSDLAENSIEPLIIDSPELKHYKRMALEFIKHQRRLSIIENPSIRDIITLVKDKVTASALSGRELKHFSEYLVPFIYGRLLGVNNIDVSEINDIFQYEDEIAVGEDALLPLATELKNYAEMLDDELHTYWEDPNNVGNKDTDYTRSRLFKQGIIIEAGKIKLNPQVLQQHYTHPDRIMLQNEFSELPLALQRKLVLYDLVKNGWNGEESLYPIFPYDITSYITSRAKMFKENEEEFADNIIKKAYKRIRDLESLAAEENDMNYLPSVFLNKELPNLTDDPSSKSFEELYKKLGHNKAVTNRINGRENFRVNVSYISGGKRINKVIEINAIGPYVTKDDGITEYSESKAKDNDEWSAIARDLITSKTSRGFKLVGEPKLELLETSNNVPKRAHMILINDNSTDDNGGFIKDDGVVPNILSKEAIDEDAILQEEKNSKKKSSVVGRFFKDDYYNYTREDSLDQSELMNAYEYKQSLTYIQEARIWLNYLRDKKKTNSFLEKYKEGEFKKHLQDIDTEEVLKLYNTWGRYDAYAAANIMVPVMLELTQRASNEQSALTKVQEGQNDIGVIKAWFQTNNIDSTHPATQAVQRELETEFKGFMNERKKYLTRINDATENLYAEKFNYNPAKNSFIKKIQRAAVLLFKNRDDIYRILYGNIITTEYRTERGKDQKRYALLSDNILRQKLANNEITQVEYNFAKTFREITNELDPKINDDKYIGGGIPAIGMGRLESFGRKGLLGVLINSRPIDEAIGDVELEFEGQLMRFKHIEDIFRQDKKSSWKTNKEYIQLRNKAKKLFKVKKNEDGSMFKHEDVFNHTILGDGMVNNFANGGWINADHMASLDLNKALSDFTHTQLFITGNKNFKGFKALQATVDGLLLHNKMKGFVNQNKFVRKVYKEYFLKAKKLQKDSSGDRVIDAIVRGNLLYIMGWKLLAVGKGMYTIGNVVVGKYNNIKNQGGKAWLMGESRFWGKHKKAMGILKTINFTDANFYDDVNLQSSSGLDSIFTDIALWPMMASEKWIQGVHFLGMLSKEQYDKFDENGNYKVGETEITAQELTKMENEVKNSHGKGYTPTDQRLIQRYSWGRAIMQFSRFIPTMVYDKFAKEDVNIYGEKHIGSLTAVWEMIAKFTGGEIPIGQLGAYRAGLEPQIRARFDAGLKGLAMISVAIIAGETMNLGVARELTGDANYLVNTSKLEFKAMPSSVRTILNMLSGLAPTSDAVAMEGKGL
jgi:hypothetical protein